jgi:hypothetical protein
VGITTRYALLGLILVCFAWFGLIRSTPPTRPPGVAQAPPTEGFLDRGELKTRRSQWIETIHGSGPGLDWRALDAAARAQRLRQKSTFAVALPGAVGEWPKAIRQTAFGPWRELGSSNQSGRVVGAAVDPVTEQVYVHSHGGVVWSASREQLDWRPLNDATSFQPRFTNATFVRLPGPDARLLVGSWSPEGIYFSDDDGAHWQAATGLRAGALDDQVMVARSNHNHVYSLRYEWPETLGDDPRSVLYGSTDRGSHFNKLAVLAYESRTSMFAQNAPGSAVYVLAEDRLSRVDPQTQSVQLAGQVPIGFPLESILRVGVCGGVANSRDFVYAFYRVASPGGATTRVYRTLDGGASWSERAGPDHGMFTWQSTLCSATNADVAFVGSVNASRTIDGGASWQLVSDWVDYHLVSAESHLHSDIIAIDSWVDRAGVERILFSTDGGLFESSDYGSSVRNLTLNGLANGQYYTTLSLRRPPFSAYAGSQDQGYQHLADPDLSRIGIQKTNGDYGSMVSADGGEHVWMVHPGFALFDDRGASAEVRNGLSFWGYRGYGYELQSTPFIPALMAVPGEPRKAWLGGGMIGNATRIVELEDVGGFIQARALAYEFPANLPITAMAASPNHADTRYVVTQLGRFYVSHDAGESFQLRFEGLPPAASYTSEILADPLQPGRVLVAGAGYFGPAVMESLDDGVSFHGYAQGLPNTMVYALAMSRDGQHLFAATALGPYYFERGDPGTSGWWRHIGGDAAPDQTYWDVEFVDELNAARFATYGRGLWEVRVLAPATVTIPAQAEPALAGVSLPAPTPPNANCPSGFFVVEVGDGPGAGFQPGSFGLELLLQGPGTRELAGGLNFGANIDASQVGFAGFNLANAQSEPQRLNLELFGSKYRAPGEPLAVRVRITRRTASASETVFEAPASVTPEQGYRHSLELPPGFYEATVGVVDGRAGGAPDGNFQFSLTTQFIDRPGGGFQGGAVVGGYHGLADNDRQPSGFAAFCLAVPHSASVRALSAPSYGELGARDLRVRLRSLPEAGFEVNQPPL